MNLSKLFEMQKELDAKIVREKGLEGQDLLPQKILALQVELGELANEWRGFKFWSKDQQPRTEKNEHDFFSDEVTRTYNPLLEEYVDCLHFILSIGLDLKKDHTCLIGFEWVTNQKQMQKHITERFTELMSRFGGITYDDYYADMLYYFIDLGYMLGFTSKEIESAYISKNEVNHARQASGY